MKEITLPPYDAIKGRSTNIYKEYAVLRKKSGDFSLWIKKQYGRQDAKCFYCRSLLKNKRVNVEHIIPKSKGGSNNSKNLVLSCAQCNKTKGSKLLSKDYVLRQRKKVKKQHRRSAAKYYYERKVQEQIAEQLSWI